MRCRAVLVLSAVLIVAAGAGSSVGAGSQPVRIVAFAEGKEPDTPDEAVGNVECMLGFRAFAVYHKSGVRGFAARLSDTQLRRLERSALFRPALVERGNFLLNVAVQDSGAAEQRMADLERSIGFTVDVRFNRGRNFRGWGATLDWDQLRRLDAEADVGVTQNPSSYIVWFDHLYGEAAVQRTTELEQRYGFKATFVFQGLGGFAASLTNTQLAGLSGEPNLVAYTGGGGGSASINGPVHVNCLHVSPEVRRDLLRAFRRAHPGLKVRGPVGRVLYARLARKEGEVGPIIVTRHALATFRVRSRRVTELFQQGPSPYGWGDKGRVGKRLCTDRLDSAVLETWLFRPVLPYGCYARN